MAKRLSVIVSDEAYNELMSIRGTNETLSLMDLVRASINLLVWYNRQKRDGFTVCALKETGSRETIREIILEGL